jgi:hypothetical protein
VVQKVVNAFFERDIQSEIQENEPINKQGLQKRYKG